MLGTLGQDLIVETLLAQADVDGTVEPFFHRHRIFLTDRRWLLCGELVPGLVEAQSEVVVHGSLCVPGEYGVESVFFFDGERSVEIA